jgi:hypothetical protein
MRVTKKVDRNSAAQRAAGMADTSPYTRSNCTHAAVAVVEVSIRRLRAKIDDAFERKLIHTLRGVGYVLEERE